MEVRLDKWLQIARMFKTRTQANRACTLSRVQVNGQSAKPHRAVVVGDRIEIERAADWTQVVVVRELRDRPVAKAEAASLYADESPPRPVLSELERLMRRPSEIRERGAGRPTKKERREMERWKG
jgi:ribosome-associated heat shock protein Hsp15